MPVTTAWENESRDERGRWTDGGGNSHDNPEIDGLKGKLVAWTGPLLDGARGGAGTRLFSQGDLQTTPHVERTAKLLHTWNQAADWSDRAFRDHFFSPMHKMDFASGIRQAAQRLQDATGDSDHRAAASDLGWRIGQYGPTQWVKDLPALQKRGDAALDPQAPSLGLQGFGNVKQATHFEYEGLKAMMTRRAPAPAFDRDSIGADGTPVAAKLEPRPATPTPFSSAISFAGRVLNAINPIASAEATPSNGVTPPTQPAPSSSEQAATGQTAPAATAANGPPSAPPPAKAPFDGDKAAAKLRSQALPGPNQECGRYVKSALRAGGLDVGVGVEHAKNMGPPLEKAGFDPVAEEGYIPRKGDVAVIQPYSGGNESGHIAMYDGRQWISDTRQRDMWGGHDYRTLQPPYQVYRRAP
jgi:hypothetical protein